MGGMPNVVEKVDQLGFHGDANGSNRFGGWVYDHLRLLSAVEVVSIPSVGRVERPFVRVSAKILASETSPASGEPFGHLEC